MWDIVRHFFKYKQKMEKHISIHDNILVSIKNGDKIDPNVLSINGLFEQ